MQAVVQPSRISGSLSAPPSKSMMQRACLAALLKGGITRIRNRGYSADDAVMLRFLQEAGCNISTEDDSLKIDAADAGLRQIKTFDFGDSGLAARMCIPLLALKNEEQIIVTGSAQLQRRSMSFYETVLRQIGVEVTATEGRLPISIKGPLIPKSIEIDAGFSSQFITGLLMAYSAADAQDVTVTCRNMVSAPYIDLTLETLQAFGLRCPATAAPGVYHFDSGLSLFSSSPIVYAVPGDWSGAAFLLVAGALAGDVTAAGLDAFSSQGDKAVLHALMDAGVSLSIMADSMRSRKALLKAFYYNATDTPDLFPPLAALAIYASGTSVIEGISRLRGKESDRAVSICEELTKMGADIKLQEELMIIEGGKPLQGAAFSAHGDHRIAMMCAIAALGASSLSTIEGYGAVAKSYPLFWQDMQSLGAAITIE